MKIAHMRIYVGEPSVLTRHSFDKKPGGFCAEVTGVVEGSEIQVEGRVIEYYTGPSTTLWVNGQAFRLDGNLPRIDCGEEVVIHLDRNKPCGFQVIRNGEAILRAILPQGELQYGYRHYAFEYL